jgi:hypothetical protein
MPHTADFDDQIADTGLSEAAGVMDGATAPDAAVDMFDAHATAADAWITGFLRTPENPVPWLPRRHDHLDPVKRER